MSNIRAGERGGVSPAVRGKRYYRWNNRGAYAAPLAGHSREYQPED